MKPVSMKLPKRSAKESNMPMAVSSGQKDEYPYGLKITLSEDQVKNLPHVMGYKVGDDVSLMAVAKIVGMRTDDQQGGKTERTVDIQITSLSCEGDKDMSKMSDEEYGRYHKSKKLRD